MTLLVQVASILIAGGGSFALMKGPFPMSNFFIAGTLVYMGTIVLEGVSMSLTSKVRLQLVPLSHPAVEQVEVYIHEYGSERQQDSVISHPSKDPI